MITPYPSATMIVSALKRLKRDTDNAYFTIFNQRIECVPSRSQERVTIDIGGAQVDIDTWLYVLEEDIPANVTVDDTSITVDSTEYTADSRVTDPRVGNIINFEGRELRIIQNEKSPCGSHWKMNLQTIDR